MDHVVVLCILWGRDGWNYPTTTFIPSRAPERVKAFFNLECFLIVHTLGFRGNLKAILR
jgi:hypothetical protein